MGKQERPSCWLLTDGIRKLWSYLLHNRLSSADTLNLLYHSGRVAMDARYSSSVAGHAALRYFHSALDTAWRESRRSRSAEELTHNVSVFIYEFDAELARSSLEEQAALAGKSHEPETSAKGRAGQAAQIACMQHIMGTSKNHQAQSCKFRHGCPFCSNQDGKPSAEVRACFERHLRSQGFSLSRSTYSPSSQFANHSSRSADKSSPRRSRSPPRKRS